MRVSIGSDHAGFEQKQALVDYLVGKGHMSSTAAPTTMIASITLTTRAPVAHDVADGVAERGVLVCGTGISVAMAADKVPTACVPPTSSTPSSPPCAARAQRRERHHPSGRFVPLPRRTERILDTFFATDPGGRHAGRVQKIMELD